MSGTEVHLQLLLDGLRRGGDEAMAFSLPPRSGLLRLADAWDPAARDALAREVEAFGPDVLHFHNVVRELSVAVLTAAPGTPRVTTAHDGRLLGDADGQSMALRAWQRLRARWDRRVARTSAGSVLAVSGPLEQRFRAAGFGSVRRAWPWAEEPTSPMTRPAASRDLAFLGRLDPDKGLDVLVQAFLAADRPGAKLLLAGRGSLSPSAHGGRVLQLGTLNRLQVSELLSSVRAVVLPSVPARRPEGAPLALIEGLVHGRPLLVSDDPGCAEIARTGTGHPAGLVVPAGDVAALAAAIGRLLDDDSLVDRLAEGARLAAPDHSADAGLARVRAAYVEVLR